VRVCVSVCVCACVYVCVFVCVCGKKGYQACPHICGVASESKRMACVMCVYVYVYVCVCVCVCVSVMCVCVGEKRGLRVSTNLWRGFQRASAWPVSRAFV
jgi:hypothetical protein